MQTVMSTNPVALAVEGSVLYSIDGPASSIVAYDLLYGRLQTLAPAQNLPGDLVVHAPYVFWTTADGVIHRVLEDGGAPGAVFAPGGPTYVAANSRRLYWWEVTSGSAYSVPVDSDGGDTPVTEYTGTPGASGCVNADEATFVVVTGNLLIQRAVDSGRVFTATLPYLSDPQACPLTDSYAVALTWENGPGTTGDVYLVPKGSNQVQQSATFSGYDVRAFAADPAGVYWATTVGGVDGCTDLSCTAGVQHFTPDLRPYNPTALAIDPEYLYVASMTVEKFAR
jgi:hypothetical protein